jgi:hypothetical protein
VCAACGFYGKRAVLQKKDTESSSEAGGSSS